MGAWLWFLLALAAMLLLGIVVSTLKLRRAGRSAKRPIVVALVVGLIVVVMATFAVPGWTLADIGALSAAVDYDSAFLFALVPGAIIGAMIFVLTAIRCATQKAAIG